MNIFSMPEFSQFKDWMKSNILSLFWSGAGAVSLRKLKNIKEFYFFWIFIFGDMVKVLSNSSRRGRHRHDNSHCKLVQKLPAFSCLQNKSSLVFFKVSSWFFASNLAKERFSILVITSSIWRNCKNAWNFRTRPSLETLADNSRWASRLTITETRRFFLSLEFKIS